MSTMWDHYDEDKLIAEWHPEWTALEEEGRVPPEFRMQDVPKV